MKKGSISLSINMIVVVVLAFVMLGLMLGLGRSIMNQAGDGATSLLGQTKQDIETQLIQTDEPLYFSQREYDVRFNDKVTLNFGVKNTEPSPKYLTVHIYTVNAADGKVNELSPKKSASRDDPCGAFYWAKIPMSFAAGQGKASDVQYRSPSNRGTCIFKFVLTSSESSSSESVVVSEELIYVNII